MLLNSETTDTDICHTDPTDQHQHWKSGKREKKNEKHWMKVFS